MSIKELLLDHDEISIREAFERLLNGLEVTNSYGRIYKMANKTDLSILVNNPHDKLSPDRWIEVSTLLSIVDYRFFVKKPFDVRKALMDNPDEVVATLEIPTSDERVKRKAFLFFDTIEMSIFYAFNPYKKGLLNRLKETDLLHQAVPYKEE